MLNSRSLRDDKTLTEYEICNGDTIMLLVSMQTELSAPSPKPSNINNNSFNHQNHSLYSPRPIIAYAILRFNEKFNEIIRTVKSIEETGIFNCFLLLFFKLKCMQKAIVSRYILMYFLFIFYIYFYFA